MRNFFAHKNISNLFIRQIFLQLNFLLLISFMIRIVIIKRFNNLFFRFLNNLKQLLYFKLQGYENVVIYFISK
jgi:hypothetical protein